MPLGEGDSGSLVVDPENSAAFGLVIACTGNIVHVAPLYHILGEREGNRGGRLATYDEISREASARFPGSTYTKTTEEYSEHIRTPSGEIKRKATIITEVIRGTKLQNASMAHGYPATLSPDAGPSRNLLTGPAPQPSRVQELDDDNASNCSAASNVRYDATVPGANATHSAAASRARKDAETPHDHSHVLKAAREATAASRRLIGDQEALTPPSPPQQRFGKRPRLRNGDTPPARERVDRKPLAAELAEASGKQSSQARW